MGMTQSEMTTIIEKAKAKQLRPALNKDTDILCFTRSSQGGKLETLKWDEFFHALSERKLTVTEREGYLNITRGPGYKKKPRTKFGRLKRPGRRQALLQYVTFHAKLLGDNKYSYAQSARVLDCRVNDIYYLIKFKFLIK